MIKKINNCTYCGEKMESKTAKKKFCSTKCRIYYNRELARGTLDLPKLEIQIDKLTAWAKSTELGAIAQKMADSKMRPFIIRNFNPDGSVEGIYTDACKSAVNVSPCSFDSAIKRIDHADEMPMFTQKPKLIRSFDNYQQLKLDCENSESWNELKNEILASNLSSKQKAFLIN